MHPEDIKATIRKKGGSQSKIAASLKVSDMAVSLVIHGHTKSARIAKSISAAAGQPVSKLWPGKYPELEFLEAVAAQPNKATPPKRRAAA